MTPMEPVTVMGSNGPVPLHEVFEGRRMLIVYHFMWNKGAPHHKQCEGCTHSQVAMTAAVCAYLAERDVSYAVFSSGPLEEILAYRDFMGWTTPWYSTADSGQALATRDGGDLRCYLRTDDQVFQTYETKWRGIEAMLPTLQLLDLTPYGRQETWEDSPWSFSSTKLAPGGVVMAALLPSGRGPTSRLNRRHYVRDLRDQSPQARLCCLGGSNSWYIGLTSPHAAPDGKRAAHLGLPVVIRGTETGTQLEFFFLSN